MIDKLIAEYLTENKRLVVPEFGAFIHKEGSGIVLVEFLKKDDGVLSSLIAKNKGIDEHTAAAEIQQYVAIIKQGIAESGAYQMAGLGRIYLTRNGTYELDNLGNIPAPQPKQVKIAEPAAESAPTPIRQTEPVTKQHVSQPVQKNATPEQPAHRTADPERKPMWNAPTPTPTSGSTGTRQPRPQHYRPANRRASAPPPKKKTDMVMIIAILAALLALAALGFAFLVNGSPAGQLKPTNPAVEQITLPANDDIQP